MIPFTLSEIAVVLHAEWVGSDRVIQEVVIDSTQVTTTQCLFVALCGKNFDGHCFVNQAICMGAHALLVNRYYRLDIPQLIVKDTYLSLVKLIVWIRKQVSPKIIAITGSNGKTSVKEMTVSILRNMGQVLSTHGNWNNKIGVLLTMLRLTPQDDFAVIELGANDFGEISWMSSVICPDIVLVNNIFSAHLFGFGSLIGVAEAKGELFSSLSIRGICVVNADNNAWFLWKKLLIGKSIVTFSIQKKNDVDFFVSDIVCYQDKMQFILYTPFGYSSVTLSMLGVHSISNSVAASALAMSAGATLKASILGLEKMRPISGRLFPIILGHKKLLLDDSYNSNIGSILASVRVLRNFKGYRVIVVGDVAELGEFIEVKYHEKIGELITMTDIEKVLSIGYLSRLISGYSGRGEHFYNKDMLFLRIMDLIGSHEIITILIKGSRNMLMDQLVVELQEQILYDGFYN